MEWHDWLQPRSADAAVAPVAGKSATARRVYLPEGAWFDWWTGEKYEGRCGVERPVDLETLTLYLHASANGAFTFAITAWINLRWDDARRVLTITPDKRMKKWPGGTRAFAVEVVG